MSKSFLNLLLSTIGIVFLGLTPRISAQETLQIQGGCQFLNGYLNPNYTVGKPSEEMRQIFKDLIEAGENRSVQILLRSSPEANNANATIIGNRKYIIYNESFVEKFNTNSLTAWSARFLLAHEIGHHIHNHTFESNSQERNHKNELEADRYATKVLVTLGADHDETIAGLSTLADVYGGESFTHPAPTTRITNVSLTWKEEMRKQITATPDVSLNTNLLADKASLRLDPTAFRNPWTVISGAKGEIDGEKVIISFNLPEGIGQREGYKICLLSNNPDINPGKNDGSVFDPTISNRIFTAGETKKLIWNYRMDRYTRQEVEIGGDLRFYVFDRSVLPHEPSTSAIVGGSFLTSLGTGAVVWGLIEFFEGKDHYNNTYLITRNDEDYEKADSRFVRGQYLMGSGIIVGLIGYRFLSRYAKRLHFFRNSVCSLPGMPALTPGINQFGLHWTF